MHIATSTTPAAFAAALVLPWLAAPVLGQGAFTAPNNATGSVPIPGFRLDRPYPGDWDDEANALSWSLSMEVTDTTASNGRRFTGIVVRLDPPPPGSPEGAIFAGNSNSNDTSSSNTWIVPWNVTETWRLVVVRFAFDELRSVEDPNDTRDGSCPASVLSDACQLELRNAVKTQPEAVYNIGVSGTGYPNIVPNAENCTGYTEGTQAAVSLDRSFYSTTSLAFSYGNNDSDGDDTYDKYGSRTYPIMLVWARALEQRNGTFNTEFPEIEDSHITFACVKVDTLAQDNATLPDGSQWYGENGEEEDEEDDDGSDGNGGSGGGAEPPSAGNMLGLPGATGWGVVGFAGAFAMLMG